MQQFLKNVASAYVQQSEVSLSECCFVFPNRRSGIFFKKYIADVVGNKSMILPNVTTITDMVTEMSGDIDTGRIEQLFVLYRAYRNIAEKRKMQIAAFSKFIFWGDMIINDFTDVDKSLADARLVFSNLKNNNEIRSAYLDKEQLAAIEDFFGIKMRGYGSETDDYGNPVDRFWLHTGNDNSEGKFLQLWSVLFPLYDEFNRLLKKEGKSYQGAMFRNVVTMLSNLNREDLPWKRYIFVGFNRLTESERKIFRIMQQMGIGDYYWDCNSPILNNSDNPAVHFIKTNRKRFPPRYDDFESDNNNKPNITVVSVPSATGMTKVAANILSQIPDKELLPTRGNAINTAIVIPDEDMFLPMYSAIPKEFESVNITLGSPMRNFGVTTLLSTIIALHRRTWEKDGEWHYFHEDVKNLLSNPYISNIAPDAIINFLEELARSKQKMVKISALRKIDPRLNPIFRKIGSDSSSDEAISYVEQAIKLIIRLRDLNNCDDDKNKAKSKHLDDGLLGRLNALISQLKYTLKSYRDIDLQGDTYLLLIQRLINSSTIPLEGEPLRGLQVLGMLETRNLDFDNLIVLSANEKIFPRKTFSKSIIPQNLRIGYNLTAREHEESVNTYYFYRLISRAKNVYLIYDSRSTIRSGGEQSRYIYQLRYLYRDMVNITDRNYIMKIRTHLPAKLEVVKTPRIMDILNRYRSNKPDDPNRKFFSASALKKYLMCPLQFHLTYIEGLKPAENHDSEFIDSPTFGTILHDTMKELYYGDASEGYHQLNKELDSESILKLKDSLLLDQTLLKLINHIHYNISVIEEAKAKPATGEALLITAILKKYIHKILDYDAARAPITFIDAEHEEKQFWQLTPEIGINFKQYIDRKDCLPDGTIRIIDYKTGGDSLSIKSVSELFTQSKNLYKVLGVFQLMVYCNFHNYVEQQPYRKLMPLIYKTKDFYGRNSSKSEEFKIAVANEHIVDYHTINEEFMQQFTNMVEEIFDPKIPFRQCNDTETCRFCGFADICRRI